MNKRFIDVVSEMPKLCKAEDAERWGAVMQMIFLDELNNPYSKFHKNDEDYKNPRNRLKIAFAWECENRDKKKYCEDLVYLRMLNHYIKDHDRKDLEAERDALIASIDARSAIFEDVNAVMPKAEQMSSYWDY